MSAVEYVPGGLEIEEAKVLARLVEEAGADCIHCSQGVYASTQHIIPPSVVARGAYVQNAAAIKSAVHIPVIRGPHQRYPGGGEHFAVRPGRFGHHGPGLFGGPGDAQENPRGPGGRGAAVHRLPAGLRRRKRQRPLCPLPGEPPDGHGGRVRLLSRQGAQAGAGHWRGACPGARRPSPQPRRATG